MSSNGGSSEVEESDSAFKRRLALLAAGIAMLASVTHLLDDVSSRNKATASRDAQRKAMEAHALQVLGATEYGLARGVYRDDLEAGALGAEATRAYFDSYRTGREAPEYLAEAEMWRGVRDALDPLSPLLRPGRFKEAPGELLAETDKRARLAELQRDARVEVARFWDGLSDKYTAILTTIAIAAVLLGLASVTGEGRAASRALEIPAMAMAGVCLVAILYLPTREAPFTPVAAMRHVAEGDRLFRAERLQGGPPEGAGGRMAEATREYEKALVSRPDYPAAHRQLGIIHLFSGTDAFEYEADSHAFQRRFGNPEGLDAAILSLEKAVGFDRTDTGSLGDLGFAYLRVGRYRDARRVTTQAIALDGTQPVLWLNLMEVSTALGDKNGAERALATGVDLLATSALVEKDALQFIDLLGGARSGLEAVAEKAAGSRDLAERLNGLLLVRERQLLNLPPPGTAPRGGRALRIRIRFDAPGPDGGPLRFLGAGYDFTGVPGGTAITHLWFFRRDGGTPWNSMDGPSSLGAGRYMLSEGPPSGQRSFLGPLQADGCWRPGEYRIDIYAGDGIIGTTTAQPPAGLLCHPAPG